MKKTVLGLLIVTFVLTGCSYQQSAPSTKTASYPVAPISLSEVDHVTLDTFLERNLKRPVDSVVISTASAEKELINEIDSSKTVPPPPAGTKVVAPNVGPDSVSYKIIVSMKNDQPDRIFRLGPWGGTRDVTYGVGITPGLSRDLLKRLSSTGKQQK